MNKIASKQNNVIKLIKKLKEKKYRYQYRLFFDEGIKNIDLSLSSNYIIKYLIVRENFKEPGFLQKITAQLGEQKIYQVTEEIFDTLKDTVNSQGILAVYEMPSEVNFSKENENADRVLFLDHLNDPGNLGTIIRTALAGGISTIYYTKGTVDIYSPKVVRSAMGSLYFANMQIIDNIKTLHEIGYKIYSSSLEGSAAYKDSFTDEKIALVIGSEANGISDEVIAISDKKIKIPMDNKVAESLNASVAAGILIFEMMKDKLSL